ncbi:MAG: Ty1/Copia family ribonuclease HI, partial [bacterium]
AEYVALGAATQDAAYLLRMLSEMGMGNNAPINILEDNQACISVGTRDIASPKLKHIDIRYHYVRTMVQEGKIRIMYCPTFHLTADILTKGVDKLTFIRHRSTLMGMPFRP